MNKYERKCKYANKLINSNEKIASIEIDCNNNQGLNICFLKENYISLQSNANYFHFKHKKELNKYLLEVK